MHSPSRRPPIVRKDGAHPAQGRAPRRQAWALRFAVAGVVFASSAVAGAYVRGRYLPEGAVLPGLAIDGERVASPADAAAVRAHVERHAAERLGRRVRLVLPGAQHPALETTLEQLGLRVDVDETLAVAARVGKMGDVLARAEAARRAREGALDVPLFAHVDRDVAVPAILALKETEDTQPVSARLDLEKHTTVREKDGVYVDADGLVTLLDLAARDPAVADGGQQAAREPRTIELPVATFAPRISSAFLSSLDVSTVVSEYETYFSRGGDQKLRGKNIDNAAQKLDGLVVSPGELVSFNDVIGERSEGNGFHKSWEIFKGEMVEGVGGGTCQVASTFHAATLFAGFDVLERLPHSRPSAYIPMGLDSTVVYPSVDLKVRNPHPFPVVVHAKTEGNKLRIELLGKSRPVRVAFGRELVETMAYKRKIAFDPQLSGKKVVVKQHGIRGFKIKRERVITYADGRQRKETSTDTYPSTAEIYHVPVGFDVSLLPPLPADEGEDADASSSPATARSSEAASVATACADCTSGSDVEFVEAPGAHAPTSGQAKPPKTMTIRR